MKKEYGNPKKIQKRIDKFAEKYAGKKIVLYGAGAFFEDIYKELDFSKLNIVGISDKKFLTNCSKKLFEINCYSIVEINDLDFDVILITVLNPNCVETFLKENIKKTDYILDSIKPKTLPKLKLINPINLLFKKKKPAQNDIYVKLEFSEFIEKTYLLKPYFKNFNINEEEYRKLVSNLDDKSIISISRILNRIKNVTRDYSIKYKDIFTPEEIETYRKMHEDLYDVIQNFGNGIYAYKNYYLPVSHFEHNVFYFNHNMEGINLDFIKDKDIIDVGAYVGDSAIVLSKYTDKNVISFEANPINFNLLQHTMTLNNIKNIKAINLGLGDKESIVNFSNIYSSDSRIINSDEENAQKVNIITLDKYVKENNIKCGLLKIDIEGAEPQFLQGAYNTIKEQRPTILLSIYHNAHDLVYLKSLIESWNLGYKFRIVSPSNGYIVIETMLICEREEICLFQ